MNLKNKLEKRNISLEELSGILTIPLHLLKEIADEEIDLEDCKYKYVKKLASFFGVSTDFLVYKEERFDIFRSNLHHELKNKGDIGIVEKILSNRLIDYYVFHEDYIKAMYLLATLDYLSKKNNIEICKNYNTMREKRFQDPIFMGKNLFGVEDLEEEKKKCIPEFLKYNIFEGDLYDAI